jgi:hypothetical protein
MDAAHTTQRYFISTHKNILYDGVLFAVKTADLNEVQIGRKCVRKELWQPELSLKTIEKSMEYLHFQLSKYRYR